MRMTRVIVLGSVLLLAACANDKGVRVLSAGGNGPDEFAILPTAKLEQPANYAELPAPTPDGRNLVDTDPFAEAAAALGGKRTASAPTGTSFPSGDRALVTYASRSGTDASIRDTLADEDAAIRKRYSRFSGFRLSGPDRYNEIYRRYHLNAWQEIARWRRAGVKTPAAPQ